MKNTGYLLLALTLSLSQNACKDELQLNAPWKDIPVIYGMIDRTDTAYYIRVEKVFINPEGDITEIAQIPDSIYYPEDAIAVFLTDLESGTKKQLQRVDGNLEGYPREAGPFADQPNYLYKLKASVLPLGENVPVGLTIERQGSAGDVTAEAAVLGEISPSGLIDGSQVTFKYDQQNSFRWTSGSEARIFDVEMHIHYDEWEAGHSQDAVSKTLVWTMARSVPRSSSSSTTIIKIDGIDFYTTLAASLEAKPTTLRQFTGMDMIVIGAGQAVEEYIKITQANTGITAAQDIPTYTNIDGGLGLFSSISKGGVFGLQLSSTTLDLLKNGEYTADLNFQ